MSVSFTVVFHFKQINKPTASTNYFYKFNGAEMFNHCINNITAYKHVGRDGTGTVQDKMNDFSPYINENYYT